MRIYLNDLSLDGQYPDTAAFRADLALVLRARATSQAVREGLHCLRNTADLRATPTESFREAVQASKDPTFRRIVLEWIGKRGPFAEDDRTSHPDDLFHFGRHDVTDRGLGEAARRRLAREEAIAFGFEGSPNGCDLERLDVLHGLVEDPFGSVPVPNVKGPQGLDAIERSRPRLPRSWQEMLACAEQAFPSLILGEDLGAILRPHPFDANVCERALVLLGVLEEFVASRNADGTHSDRTNELISAHFSGSKAWFSDESSTNKHDFKQAMTFPDPTSSATRLFCPFHGKIKSKQYRIHFPWPIAATESKIRIVYIGPKITRS